MSTTRVLADVRSMCPGSRVCDVTLVKVHCEGGEGAFQEGAAGRETDADSTDALLEIRVYYDRGLAVWDKLHGHFI